MISLNKLKLNMLTAGHIAASYLLAESAKTLGIPLTNSQVLTTVIFGNLPDIDYLYGLLIGKKGESHHRFITHTPLVIFTTFLLFVLLFEIEILFSLVLFFSLLIHLVLDDLGYWIYKLKFFTYPINPQINWFYPCTKISVNPVIKTNKEVLRIYLTKAWPASALEILLVLSAIILFIKNYY